jgi:hypothetical protein
MSISNLNTTIIDEIALRCGDVGFKTFPKTIYQQSYYRAARTIAKKFNILEKIYITTCATSENAYQLDIPNFQNEIRVRINDVIYQKINYDKDLVTIPDVTKSMELIVTETGLDSFDSVEQPTTGKYQLSYVDGELYLDWYPRASNDEIFIHYIGLPDIDDTEDCFPYIPSSYEETLIEFTVKELVKLALARFVDKEEVERWTRIAQLYNTPTKKDDVKNNAWISVKVWSPL